VRHAASRPTLSPGLRAGALKRRRDPLDIAGRNATGEVAANRRGGNYKRDDERLRRLSAYL